MSNLILNTCQQFLITMNYIDALMLLYSQLSLKRFDEHKFYLAMISFKKSVMDRLESVFTFAKGKQDYLNPDGYKIAITALLGFTPTNWETDEVFKNQNGLNLQQLSDLVEYKLKYIYAEQYICDIFSNFDSDYKGYVTLTDVYKAWSKVKSDFCWGKIEEAFRVLSHNGILDFFNFQEAIIEHNSSDCRTSSSSFYNI